MRMSGKDVGKFLFCLGVLEGKAFQLYGRLSEKVESPYMRFSLLYMAYDSLKNSVILGELSKSLGRSVVKDKDYKMVLGEVWEMVHDLSSEILKMETIEGERIIWLMDKLVAIYSVTIVQLKTLGFMRREICEAYNVDIGDLKDILDLVIGDEEVDTQILMDTKERARAQGAVTDKRPVVKYSNPDSWYKTETTY